MLIESPSEDPTGVLSTMKDESYPDKIRPILFQARDPRVTSKYTSDFESVYTSYNLVFIPKENSHKYALMRESENISHFRPTVYHETSDLLESTTQKIYDK